MLSGTAGRKESCPTNGISQCSQGASFAYLLCETRPPATCRYLQYPLLQSLLHKHIHADDRILILGLLVDTQAKAWLYLCSSITSASRGIGCGLSLLGEDMAADGYRFLQAVDYSETCIQVQSQHCCLILISMQLAAVLASHHRQHASFSVQTMQAHAAKEHRDWVTYSIMDVTALQIQV